MIFFACQISGIVTLFHTIAKGVPDYTIITSPHTTLKANDRSIKIRMMQGSELGREFRYSYGCRTLRKVMGLGINACNQLVDHTCHNQLKFAG